MQDLRLSVESLFSNGGMPMVGLAILSFALYCSLGKTLLTVIRVRKSAIRNSANLHSERTPSELRSIYRTYIKKRLRFSRVLTVSAPLLGLLGTVTGMLSTFQVLSLDKSADTTLSVAEGISMALITTQAGLMIALPALFITEWIKQLSKRCESNLFAKRATPQEL